MDEFQRAFDAQSAYFNSGVTRSYEWRIEQLDRMQRLVVENDQRLQQAMAADFKTASQETFFETAAQVATIEYVKSQLESWMAPVEAPVPSALRELGYKGVVHRDPYGVSLIIGPFNGPLTLLVHPAVTALAGGNTCILKLPEALTATSRLPAELVPQYFEPEAVIAFNGDRDVVTALLKLPFNFIFFTGSTPIGKVIMRAAAENLTPVILELGGQNPALVDETANVALAARKLAWGATAWGGQWCTSPSYAYVNESVVEQFIAEAKKALLEMYGPDPKSNPDFSRIIRGRDVERLDGLVDPAKVVAGGDFDVEARYFGPTLLYPVTWADRVMDGEIFGPMLAILPYTSLDEVFARIQANPRPLSAFVFSRNQETVERFLGTLSFGGGAVNETNVHLFVESMPFGGIGASGMGNYYGKYGFDSLTHAKSILVSPADAAIEHLFPPYTEQKVKDSLLWFQF